MKGYSSVQETARRWGISVRWVNQYVLAGQILGDSERRGQTGKAQIRAKPKEMSEKSSRKD